MADWSSSRYVGGMYCPPAFREDDPAVLRAAMRAHPLATLITTGANGISANVLPFVLVETPGGDTLRAHLAKANGQLADLRQATPALVVFHGPHAYVSPSWYPGKSVHGKVVPTWNYVMVQARGIPSLIDDAEWLRTQVDALTDTQEGFRAEPWATIDAPGPFIRAQLDGIVGLEIPIDRLQGKWKLSQNRTCDDRVGVAHGLRDAGRDDMADLIPGD